MICPQISQISQMILCENAPLVLQGSTPEVQKETELVPRGLQVVEDLRVLDVSQPGQRFCFDNDPLVANEVGLVANQSLTLVEDRQFDFAHERYSSFRKLQRQRFLIDGFEKAT